MLRTLLLAARPCILYAFRCYMGKLLTDSLHNIPSPPVARLQYEFPFSIAILVLRNGCKNSAKHRYNKLMIYFGSPLTDGDRVEHLHPTQRKKCLQTKSTVGQYNYIYNNSKQRETSFVIYVTTNKPKIQQNLFDNNRSKINSNQSLYTNRRTSK